MSPLNFPTPTPLPNSSAASPQAASDKAPHGKGFDDAMQQALGGSPRPATATNPPRETSQEKKKADAPTDPNAEAMLASMMAMPQPIVPQLAPTPATEDGIENTGEEALAPSATSTNAALFAIPQESDAEENTAFEAANGDPEDVTATETPATSESQTPDAVVTKPAVTPLAASALAPTETKTTESSQTKQALPKADVLPTKKDAKAGAIQLTADFEAVSANPELEQALADTMQKLPPATSNVDVDAAKNELSDLPDDKTPVKAQDGASGIPAAQQVVAMKKNGKSSQNPSQGEHNLPGAGADASAETTSFRAPRPARLAGNVEFPTVPHFMPGIEMPKPEMPTVTNLVAVPAHTPSLAQLESTQELVSNHALRLKQSDDGSMQVVIKPADGLQLSLHLKQVAGTVEVQAQLNQGDADFMSHHWKQLQEQLESRGIRLAPLTTEQNLTNGNNAGSRQEAPAREAQRLMAEDAVPSARRSFGSAGSNPVSTNQPQPVRSTAWEYWA